MLNEKFEQDETVRHALYTTLTLAFNYAARLYLLHVARRDGSGEDDAEVAAAREAFEQAETAAGDLFEKLGLEKPDGRSMALMSGVSASHICFNPEFYAESFGVWRRDPQTDEQKVAEEEPYSEGPFAVHSEVPYLGTTDRNCGFRVCLNELPEAVRRQVGLE